MGLRHVRRRPSVDLILRDGDVFELGARRLETVLTRGHTRGHCAFFERETGLLFSGDAVQDHGLPSTSGTSVYAPLYDDVGDYVRGLERLRALPFTQLCGAHHLPLDRDAGVARIDRSIAFTAEMDELVAGLFARADGLGDGSRRRDRGRRVLRHRAARLDPDRLRGDRPPGAGGAPGARRRRQWAPARNA